MRIFYHSFITAVAAVLLAGFISYGCTIRQYEVVVYACEGSHVDISPEILAEVPHTTTVQTEAELDMPDANVVGK